MNVSIEFEAELQQLAGTDRLSIDVSDTATVTDALQKAVGQQNNELRSRIFDDQEMIRSSLLVFVNDQSVDSMRAAQRQLQDGDSILLLPPISGG